MNDLMTLVNIYGMHRADAARYSAHHMSTKCDLPITLCMCNYARWYQDSTKEANATLAKIAVLDYTSNPKNALV